MEGATDGSKLVGATDNSILVELNPLRERNGKLLVLSASAVRWYAQTINTLVPACNEERCLLGRACSINVSMDWLKVI